MKNGIHCIYKYDYEHIWVHIKARKIQKCLIGVVIAEAQITAGHSSL